MVYFPQEVFKNIMSFACSPHPIARMLESELGVWMLSLRLNNATDHPTQYTDEEQDRQKIFDGFFDTANAICALSNSRPFNCRYDIYKQRFAGGRIGRYYHRPTILTESGEPHGLFWFEFLGGDTYGARINPFLFGDNHTWEFTNKDMIKYLKENKIKGYSKKKRIELIKMCMSF